MAVIQQQGVSNNTRGMQRPENEATARACVARGLH